MELGDVEWWRWLLVAGLVCLSAMFSGLTLGLMGLDKNQLAVVEAAGSSTERKYARGISPVRKHGNLLLCTLLLGNVIVNSGLSIIMADMTSGLVGLLVSTSLIVVFGEIVPQAACSRHPLSIGYHSVWIVKALMVLMIFITYPISRLLDCVLGKELGNIYNKQELKELLALHKDNKELEEDEVRILGGALDFAERQVTEVMTPIKKVFQLEIHEKLNVDNLTKVFKSGFSRIPCYDKTVEHDNIRGIIFVKDMILLDPKEALPVPTLLKHYGVVPPKVFPDCKLRELLHIFKTQGVHMAVVHDVNNEGEGDPFYYNVGIVTMEDVIEAIIQDEIVDETDVHEALLHRASTQKLEDHSPAMKTSLQRFKPASLSIFDSNRGLNSSVLTIHEQSAVFFHLVGTVAAFAPSQSPLTEASIKALIIESRLHTVVGQDQQRKAIKMGGWGAKAKSAQDLKQLQTEDRMLEANGHWLYKQGEENSSFCLVLDGTVEITAGRSGFRSQVTKWANLCGNVIEMTSQGKWKETRFVPDFSARVVSPSARILRITRTKILEMLQLQRERRVGNNQEVTVEAKQDELPEGIAGTSVKVHVEN